MNDDTDRERLRLAATLAAAFPDGWFIDFVEAREAAYQILGRLVEKGTPLQAVAGDGAHSVHEPGEEFHRYGVLTCEVCGQRGQIFVSIEPQRTQAGGDMPAGQTWDIVGESGPEDRIGLRD